MAANCNKLTVVYVLAAFFILLLSESCLGKEKKTDNKANRGKEKKNTIGKSVLDYTESDIHKLLDQWDVSTDF